MGDRFQRQKKPKSQSDSLLSTLVANRQVTFRETVLDEEPEDAEISPRAKSTIPIQEDSSARFKVMDDDRALKGTYGSLRNALSKSDPRINESGIQVGKRP